MIRSRVKRLPKLTRHRLPKSTRLVRSFLPGSLVWQPARRAAFSGEGKMEWKSDHGLRRLGHEVRLRRRLEGPPPLLAHRPRQPGRQVGGGGRASAVLRAGVKPRPEPAQDVATVPRTEYMTADIRAPASLSEPKLSFRPMAGPLRALSPTLLSMGTSGWSTDTHSPSRWFSSERRGLACTAVFESVPSWRSASANSAATALYSSTCAAGDPPASRQPIRTAFSR